MNTKKKFLLVTSIVLLVVMTCCMFAGCKSAAEKENDYYDKAAQSVTKRVDTLSTLKDELLNKSSWSASFMLAYTYYAIEKDGETTYNTVTRGDKNTAGWQSGSKEYVHFIYFVVDYTDMDNYKIDATTFEDTDRKTYYNNKGKIKEKKGVTVFPKKFTVKGTSSYAVTDGAESGDLGEAIVNPLAIIDYYTDKDVITASGISASDNFRVYTHFMRIESRQVYDENGDVIDREKNIEAKKVQVLDENGAPVLDKNGEPVYDAGYWSGYGEDISYNWEKVYGMTNNRLTVLYNKGKSRINQLEIYNEDVISYYTKNNKVDTSLVLKADVISYTEMVIKFNYKK